MLEEGELGLQRGLGGGGGQHDREHVALRREARREGARPPEEGPEARDLRLRHGEEREEAVVAVVLAVVERVGVRDVEESRLEQLAPLLGDAQGDGQGDGIAGRDGAHVAPRAGRCVVRHGVGLERDTGGRWREGQAAGEEREHDEWGVCWAGGFEVGVAVRKSVSLGGLSTQHWQRVAVSNRYPQICSILWPHSSAATRSTKAVTSVVTLFTKCTCIGTTDRT